jgi:hypothetical protein
MKHDPHRWNSWLLNAPDLRVGKRIAVEVIGGTVTLIGIALFVLPGPAFIVIPIGFSILATEFLWAKRWLRKAREVAANIKKPKRGKEYKPSVGTRQLPPHSAESFPIKSTNSSMHPHP